MGRLFVGVCLALYCALVMHSTAERLYFFQETNRTWDNARNYCKVCFKDLATVVPADTFMMAQNVTSDSWIGLRKYFYTPSNSTDSSTDNSTNRGVPWSRWANGDPLAFQNWYPGWPVLKSPLPKIDCCSCSCTCPAATTPLTTSFPITYTTPSSYVNATVLHEVLASGAGNLTSTNATTNTTTPTTTTNKTTTQSTTAAPTLPIESTCVRTPIPIPDFLNPNKNYIEDSCVAMLSTGAWVEKNCMDLLPFVCYEDRFFGVVNVPNITASTAKLTWQPGPDGIDHYRLEVTGNQSLIVTTGLSLTYDLVNLTAGSLYMIKVFAVQCGRDINNPQEAKFYTIPNKVVNLTVTKQQDTSITLSWNKPVGNIDLYRIDYNGSQSNSTTEGKVINDLTPGTLYKFSVLSGVSDISKWSEASTIEVYTKPGKVSNLKVSKNTDVLLEFQWDPPPGQFMRYRVNVTTNNGTLDDKFVTPNLNNVTVSGLQPGMTVTFSVTAQTYNYLEGETVTVSTYTTPGQVSGLALKPTDNSIAASWKKPEGNSLTFVVVIMSLENNFTQTTSVSAETVTFNELHTATNYTVTVRCYSGNYSDLLSPAVSSSIFTKPSPPTDAKVLNVTKDQIQVQWKPPANAGKTTYVVKLNSTFWGHSWSNKTDQTSYVFDKLKSGTKYQFEVRVLAGDQTSDPATVTQFTVENKYQIGLSMMCSSPQSLLCAGSSTADLIYAQLNLIFANKLDDVYWKLDKLKSENLVT